MITISQYWLNKFLTISLDTKTLVKILTSAGFELITKNKEYLQIMRIFSFELSYSEFNTRFLELV